MHGSRPRVQSGPGTMAGGYGTIVLTDEGFCSYLLGSIWNRDELTFSALIDRSKKQKKARAAAFQPVADAAVLQRCADTLFRIHRGRLDRLRLRHPHGHRIEVG